MITFNYLFDQVKLYKKSIIIANIVAIIITILSVPIPLFIPHVIDEIVLGKEGSFVALVAQFIEISSPVYYIVIIFVLTIILRLVATILSIFRKAIISEVAESIRFEIRKKLLTHLKFVLMSEYDTLGSGETVSKMTTDINTLYDFVSESIGNILVQLFTLTGYSIVLFYLNWKLALIILIMNPLVILFFIKIFKQVAKLLKERNSSVAKFQNGLTESLELFNQIRVQNREGFFISMVNKSAKEIGEKNHTLKVGNDKSMSLARLAIRFSMDIFRVLALYYVLVGEMSIGEMLAIFVYVGLILVPIHMILQFLQSFHDTKEAMDRLNDILRLQTEEQYEMKIDPFEGQKTASIELKDVSFAYDENREILDKFSLKIEAGDKVAITGETGSGKSTLANILMGLYPISSGEILYNGVEVKEVGYKKIRENIGFVLQSPLMFNATLRYNLSLGKEYSDEEMYEALKIAQLYDFVDDLPNKLDTIVGKNGTKLSGGQRQRLSIARVLLDKPKVIIFDESTSSLDMQTEDRLLEALDEYIQDKTVITIAHRQTTIDKADRVINLV